MKKTYWFCLLVEFWSSGLSFVFLLVLFAGMSGGSYFNMPCTVVIDDGVLYSVIYEDGKLLTTTCSEKIYWLKLEIAHLVSLFLDYFWSVPLPHFSNIFPFWCNWKNGVITQEWNHPKTDQLHNVFSYLLILLFLGWPWPYSIHRKTPAGWVGEDNGPVRY